MRFAGVYTALVTPFDAQLAVDYEALGRLVDSQIQGGVSALVAVGTTGESPTLDHEEHIEVIARVVERAAKRVPVVGGTGANSTREALSLSRAAVEVGVDAVMIVMPYYNKPTQAGLVAHTRTVAEAVAPVPVVLYNIPGRTGVDLLPESVEAICHACSNVLAIKEATGNVLRTQELRRRLGDRLAILSGDDALTLGQMSCGATGVVSVTANLLPDKVQHVCNLALAGRYDEALKAHLALLPVHDAMFLESNPGPCKAALAELGRIAPYVRAPLAWPTEATRARLREVLAPHFRELAEAKK